MQSTLANHFCVHMKRFQCSCGWEPSEWDIVLIIKASWCSGEQILIAHWCSLRYRQVKQGKQQRMKTQLAFLLDFSRAWTPISPVMRVTDIGSLFWHNTAEMACSMCATSPDTPTDTFPQYCTTWPLTERRWKVNGNTAKLTPQVYWRMIDLNSIKIVHLCFEEPLLTTYWHLTINSASKKGSIMLFIFITTFQSYE